MERVIGLASRLVRSEGDVLLKPIPGDTKIRENSRRLSRTKTLDGGCVITDGGFSDSDRTLEIVVASSETLYNRIWAIFRNSTWVTVATEEGCYLAKIDSVRDDSRKITIKVLIGESISEL